MADFDAAESFEGGAAVWACVAFFGEDEVVDFCHIEIASGFDVYKVMIGFVGAAADVVHIDDIEIGVSRY